MFMVTPVWTQLKFLSDPLYIHNLWDKKEQMSFLDNDGYIEKRIYGGFFTFENLKIRYHFEDNVYHFLKSLSLTVRGYYDQTHSSR